MTQTEFINQLQFSYPLTKNLLKARISLPTILEKLIVSLWVYGLEGTKFYPYSVANDFVKEIKKQMKALMEKGVFDFEPET